MFAVRSGLRAWTAQFKIVTVILNGNTLPGMWQACLMVDRVGSEALLRLGALGGIDAEPSTANKSLLMLLALGRLAAEGVAETPWSVAEVALADLIGRFGHDTGAADAGAARVFTGLVADQVWVLDTDVPVQGARPRALNEWRVAGKLAPDLEQVLRSRTELIGEVARGLAARSFRWDRPRTCSRRLAYWRFPLPTCRIRPHGRFPGTRPGTAVVRAR